MHEQQFNALHCTLHAERIHYGSMMMLFARHILTLLYVGYASCDASTLAAQHTAAVQAVEAHEGPWGPATATGAHHTPGRLIRGTT